jgi:hypothetical protein
VKPFTPAILTPGGNVLATVRAQNEKSQHYKKERKKIPFVLPHHWSVSLFECLSRMQIGPMA